MLFYSFFLKSPFFKFLLLSNLATQLLSMHIISNKQELKALVNKAIQSKIKIGFVPTMGALHQGHLSLVDFSLKNTDITISSIFVNPTQFNNADDFRNYPHDLKKDFTKLEKAGCHAVFTPSEKEMYPEKDNRAFDFDGLDKVMEGEYRPGHFNGVAQIVSKLFDAVTPQKAFFGQKDFQQVAIIKKMVEKLDYQIEVVACPIIREADGLAMSSRNQLLTPQHREAAPIINRVLTDSLKKIGSFKNTGQIKDWVVQEINKYPLLRVEYFEIVDEATLKQIDQIKDHIGFIGCIAVWAGNVRLIDNIIYNY